MNELRDIAKKTLAAKGHQMEDTFPCAINVAVTGNKPGCSVIFQDLQGDMIYLVEFNSRGDVSSRFAGISREGVPPKSAPPPKWPEGGVTLDPKAPGDKK